MKNQFFKMAVVTLLVLGVFTGNTWAKNTGKANEPSKPEYKDYKGILKVIKDPAGNIKSAELMCDGLSKPPTYHIVLNEDGKELAEKMAGKEVSIKGKLEEKAGAKWLAVTGYSAVSSKSAKANLNK
jgi:hypothetical protein